ncbi:MAG: peptidase T [Spirochaetaceae bacterium]|jgi:tripeptide aminopeptidase|nr:peptidase T [Spirochaetaceae bacterium]
MNEELTNLVLPRFLRYVTFCTASDQHSTQTPSSSGQWDLARALVQDLQDIGLEEVVLTDHCYVMARLPASPGKEGQPVIGFMAHLDTVADVSGNHVKPIVIERYDGSLIKDAFGNTLLDPAVDSDLGAQIGASLVHTDGSTLLGADDKAGIAEIMGALDFLLKHPEIKHGALEIVFSPDEETGKGLPEFPLNALKACACYTLDGGGLGELEMECFNAYRATVQFQGRITHLGRARGVLVNAASMAACFAALLPRSESPEATDGYYGYYCIMEMSGHLDKASLEVYIRDFEREGALRRVAALESFARTIEAQFPGGTVTLDTKPQYYNMKEKLSLHPVVVERLKRAFERARVNYKMKAIRGGTDGSRLTELGIPTPNIFTGGHNFHSLNEWASVPEMSAACRVIIELVQEWTRTDLEP